MGVFPLADTMIRYSAAPWTRGNIAAGANGSANHGSTPNGWTNEVWWYSHPTNPRPDIVASHSPTSLTPSDPTMRCSGTGRPIRPGRAGRKYRSAPAVPELAAGNRLQ